MKCDLNDKISLELVILLLICRINNMDLLDPNKPDQLLRLLLFDTFIVIIFKILWNFPIIADVVLIETHDPLMCFPSLIRELGHCDQESLLDVMSGLESWRVIIIVLS